MRRVRSEAAYRLLGVIAGLAATAAALVSTSDRADARHHRYYRVARHVTVARHVGPLHRHAHTEDYTPPGSSIVVDGNTGRALQAANAEALRHPASLTKIMTLYLLFERLEAGRIKLDAPLKVSEHAAEQAPTKLGLKPGQSIAVEDAIKAVVTKSANDAAVTIAENLGGDEREFAKLMTQKARALGMDHTTYVNASGLPDDDQVTTAADQALLGRAIQERFPRYYKFFSTEEFVYHGRAMRNHNRLLGVVGGVDGIKTGYTRASGFNLVTSVHRDGRFIVAVVMGGHSASQRDARMRELINDHIKDASLRHTAAAIAERDERAEPRGEAEPAAAAKLVLSVHADAATTNGNPKPSGNAGVGSTDPIQPRLVRTITYRTAAVPTAPMMPMPALVATTPPPPAPAAVAHPPTQAQASEPAAAIAVASTEPAIAATPGKIEPAKSEPAKADGAKSDGAKSDFAKFEPTGTEAARADTTKIEATNSAPNVEPAKTDSVKSEPAKTEAKPGPSRDAIAALATAPPPARARSGWQIQIGAFEGEDEAKQHLSEAQLKLPRMLAAADPFTERVQKGEKALFRARFAGFDKATAEAACRQLKRSDIACMTVKN
jgi:D-alanyl-D-alanine carboxypeptidase